MEVTAIFFSCRRIELLKQVVEAFEKFNTYPIFETIIVNDSGENAIHDQLRQMYPNYTLVLHPENVGLMKSIDIGYSHIKTEYFFHCEDDWMVTKEGFIEKSLEILNHFPKIEEVWLDDYNNHLLENFQLRTREGSEWFGIAAINQDGWHGFSTACALKRLSDYKKVEPYSNIERGATIWHHERAIGQKYYELGYRTAVLTKPHAINIGVGKSEYITGHEN